MKKIYSLTLLFFLFLNLSIAQTPQSGGFTYGWDNYDNSDSLGLGQRPVNWDFAGIREISHAPDSGIHPRIFFGPDEIVNIQNRLATTTSGQAVSKQIHAFTTLLNLGNNYSHNAPYGKDAFGERYIDNQGFWNSNSYYEKLIAENPNAWDGADLKRKHLAATTMALEGFECLINAGKFDPDTDESYDDRMADLAKALTFWATLAIDDPEVNSTSNKYNNFGGIHSALAYDFAFNAMTETQRSVVRQALAKITPEVPRHGAYLPAFANQSNWSTLNSFEIIINLAIEYEPGYKPDLTERWMRAYHNFINYGWYESGAGYEGLGKNYQYVSTMIACAKRGYSLLGHPHVRAYGTQFLPAIMQPFGHGVTSYDVWGGSGHDAETGGYKFNSADVVGLKWAFPNEPKIDWVWRNYIEKTWNLSSTGYVYQQIRPDDSYFNYLIPAAVFAADYSTDDWQTQADQNVDLGYFADDRGLAVLKSGTDADALAVQFHCRQDMGGHTHGDRNDFTLSALGRIWVRKSYGGSQFQPSYFHSMPMIDGKGMGVGDPDGDKCRQPGTILDWNPRIEITTVAGDATYPYTWEFDWQPRPANQDHSRLGMDGWEKVTETWNDFQMIPRDEPHFDIPWYDYPHWHQADRFERMVKREYNPMEKVYRTVAMVRGEKPFVLIADDLKKDDDEHQFEWLAQIARDLTIDTMIVNLNNENYRNDVILKEPEATGNRRLLVRILNNENFDGTTAPARMDTIEYFDYFSGNPYNSNPNYVRPRLIVESNSVEPDFKFLLFPFYENDELPVTNWNATKDTLEVTFDAAIWHFSFAKDMRGKSEIKIVAESSTGVEEGFDSGISVYPNPVSDFIFIETPEEISNVAFRLFSGNGQTVFERNLKSNHEKIDLSDFSKGVYFYEILDGKQVLRTGKIILN